jgi:hypothetical protein
MGNREQTNKRLGTASKKLGTCTVNGKQGTANGKLGTTKFELGTTNTSGQLTGTLGTQCQCIYSRVPNRGNTRHAHSTTAKRHHAGLPAPGTTETASTRHNQ